MIKFGFFNAVKSNDGSYDRTYDSEDINKYFKGAISENGIYKFVGNQCKVNAHPGMNVLIRNGKGCIKFHWFELATDEVIRITQSHPTLSRYTAVIVRCDNSNRQISLTTIDGEYEEIPSKPELMRNDNVYDICLAYVYVEAGITEIAPEVIEDTREDADLCGFVKTLLDNGSGVSKVDTLPIPQSSEVGKIYYLTRNYDEYTIGYYNCEKTKIYKYKDVIKFEGKIEDRPDAYFEYENQVYFATDENKYYACKKNIEQIYEWQEIEVNEVRELPNPGEETLNNYYLDLTDDSLHIGISEDGYYWSHFNGGGGTKEVNSRINLPSPDGSHQEANDLYYIKDENVRVMEAVVQEDSNGYDELIYTDENAIPIPEAKNLYYRHKTTDTWYKSINNIEPRNVKEYELVDVLPAKGTYTDNTLVVLNSSGIYTLYKANVAETSGYTQINNFHSVDDEPSDPINYDYYLIGGNELVLYELFIWQEIEINVVEKLPKNDITTDGKYYKEYIVKSGYQIASNNAIPITGYLNGSYVEGEGYKSTGAYMIVFNHNVQEWVLKGYTRIRAIFKHTGTITSGIYNNATYSAVYSNKFNSAASRAANTYEITYDISARTSLEYLGWYFSGNGGTLTDLWFEKPVTKKIYLMKDGTTLKDFVIDIQTTAYSHGQYQEGVGFYADAATGGRFIFNMLISDLISKGYNKVSIGWTATTGGKYSVNKATAFSATAGNVSQYLSGDQTAQANTSKVMTFDLSNNVAQYLSFFMAPGLTITDIYVEHDGFLLNEGYKINKKYNWITQDQKETIITIPVNGWTSKTDGKNTWYEKEISVPKMYSSFTGSKHIEVVRPEPMQLDLFDEYKGIASSILDIQSMDGKIKVLISDIPTMPCDLYIYGL